MKEFAVQLKILPKTGGVYIIKSKEQKPLYVGKAKNIHNRVRQHFSENNNYTKSRIIRERGYDIEIFETANEKEALLLEWNLIQEYSPPYNSTWKDGKTYPFLQITAGEKFPRIILTRRKKNKDSIYLGPYANVGSIRDSVKYALKLFPIANCRKEIQLGDSKTWAKTCIRRRTNRCFKPCEIEVDSKQYREQVDNVIRFLQGKHPELIIDIEKQMKKYAEALEFEKAAGRRDLLKSLKHSVAKQTVMVDSIDTYVLVSSENQAEFAVNLMLVKNSRVIRQEAMAINKEEIFLADDRVDFIVTMILQILGTEPTKGDVKRILNATPYVELNENLSKFGYKAVKLTAKERKLMKLAEVNLNHYLQRRMLLQKSTATPDIRIEDLKQMIRLETPPILIDVFDVSTFLGDSTVASCIRINEGRLWKKGYRRFSVKTVQGQDDFASIEEVVYRRYKGSTDNRDSYNLPLPNLVVIDGGSEQVKRAAISLSNLELEIPTIGLAKREEMIYHVDGSQPEQFDIDRPGMLLLRMARDEAHRFAITYHRQKREATGLKSILDTISGIGIKRKELIFKKYMSVANIAKASAETMNEELKIPRLIASELIEKSRKFIHTTESRNRRRKFS